LVARRKMDLFLLRPRWRAPAIVEDTTHRRARCPGDSKWWRGCSRICGWTLSLLRQGGRARYLEDATARWARDPHFGSTLQGIRLVELGTRSKWNLLHQLRVQAQRNSRIFRICLAQDHSHLAFDQLTLCRIVNFRRWQIHFVCPKRIPALGYHAGEKNFR
jgi:hypothetical protein